MSPVLLFRPSVSSNSIGRRAYRLREGVRRHVERLPFAELLDGGRQQVLIDASDIGPPSVYRLFAAPDLVRRLLTLVEGFHSLTRNP